LKSLLPPRKIETILGKFDKSELTTDRLDASISCASREAAGHPSVMKTVVEIWEFLSKLGDGIKIVQCVENLPNYGIIIGVTFSYPGEFQRDLTEFLFFCSHGVIIRDKVGNFRRFDDKTLGNELALHTKIVFTQYFALNSQCKAYSFSLHSNEAHIQFLP